LEKEVCLRIAKFRYCKWEKYLLMNTGASASFLWQLGTWLSSSSRVDTRFGCLHASHVFWQNDADTYFDRKHKYLCKNGYDINIVSANMKKNLIPVLQNFQGSFSDGSQNLHNTPPSAYGLELLDWIWGKLFLNSSVWLMHLVEVC